MAMFLMILQIMGALNGVWALIERIRKKINEIEDPVARKKAHRELRVIYRKYRASCRNNSGKLVSNLDGLYENKLAKLESDVENHLK